MGRNVARRKGSTGARRIAKSATSAKAKTIGVLAGSRSAAKLKVSLALDKRLVQQFNEIAANEAASLSSVMNDALASYLRDRALREIINSGDPLTEEDREAARKELREAGLIL